METSAQFTQQDGLFIEGQLHQFIAHQLCEESALPCEQVYQALATLVDEFGCQCRKTKHQPDDALDTPALLSAYAHRQYHPDCHMDAQTTTAVLDEYCCQVPAIIVVALMDTLTGTTSSEPGAQAIYHRAAELTQQTCIYAEKSASAA